MCINVPDCFDHHPDLRKHYCPILMSVYAINLGLNTHSSCIHDNNYYLAITFQSKSIH